MKNARKSKKVRLLAVLLGLLLVLTACGSSVPNAEEDSKDAFTVTLEEPPETTQETEQETTQETTAETTPETTKSEPETQASADDGTIDPAFKAAMDSYEAFMDEYVAFMKKYAASNGTDLSLLTDYAKYVSDYAKFVADFEKWESEEMNAAEMAYYLEVQTRVSKKLMEVAY